VTGYRSMAADPFVMRLAIVPGLTGDRRLQIAPSVSRNCPASDVEGAERTFLADPRSMAVYVQAMFAAIVRQHQALTSRVSAHPEPDRANPCGRR
jgi:hypothetical protein